jgi:hypothetical protein
MLGIEVIAVVYLTFLGAFALTREAGAIAKVTLARVKEGLYLNYGLD